METTELLPELLSLGGNGVIYVLLSAIFIRATNWLKKKGADPLIAIAVFSLVAGFAWFFVEYYLTAEMRIATLSAITKIAGYSVLIYEASKRFMPDTSKRFLGTKIK